jgi:tRNA-dihydrouridine synthase 4
LFSFELICCVQIKDVAKVPIFANGDIFSLSDAEDTVNYTRVDGVMSARGLLENPALFAGYERTPLEAVEKYVRYAVGYGTNTFIFQHHLAYMLEKSMSKAGTFQKVFVLIDD